MTKQTPLEGLEDLLIRDRAAYDPELLYEAVIAYRDAAEARIKELEAENSKLKSHDCWKEVTGG